MIAPQSVPKSFLFSGASGERLQVVVNAPLTRASGQDRTDDRLTRRLKPVRGALSRTQCSEGHFPAPHCPPCAKTRADSVPKLYLELGR